MRTIVDIPTSDIAALDEVAKRRRVSRAALIRDGVARILEENRDDAWKSAIGAWKGKVDEDGLAYQRRLRDEWPD